MPQFDYSLKAQARNPKKVYAIDNGLVDAVSTSASRNSAIGWRTPYTCIYGHVIRISTISRERARSSKPYSPNGSPLLGQGSRCVVFHFVSKMHYICCIMETN